MCVCGWALFKDTVCQSVENSWSLSKPALIDCPCIFGEHYVNIKKMLDTIVISLRQRSNKMAGMFEVFISRLYRPNTKAEIPLTPKLVPCCHLCGSQTKKYSTHTTHHKPTYSQSVCLCVCDCEAISAANINPHSILLYILLPYDCSSKLTV